MEAIQAWLSPVMRAAMAGPALVAEGAVPASPGVSSVHDL